MSEDLSGSHGHKRSVILCLLLSKPTREEKHPPPPFHLSSNLDHDIIPDLHALQSKWSAPWDHGTALRSSHTLSHIQSLLVPVDKWPIISQGSQHCSSPSLQNTSKAWSQSNGEQSSTAWAPFPGSTSRPHPDCNTGCHIVPELYRPYIRPITISCIMCSLWHRWSEDGLKDGSNTHIPELWVSWSRYLWMSKITKDRWRLLSNGHRLERMI